FCNFFRSCQTTRAAIVVTSLVHCSTRWSGLLAVSLFTQADVLIGSGVVVKRNQPEAGFRHAGADAVGPGQLIQGSVHGSLVHEALDLVQECLALLLVAFLRLLFEQGVDIGVADSGKLP